MDTKQIEELISSYTAAVELAGLLEQDETLSRYIDAEMQKMIEEGKIVMPMHRRLELHDNALDRAYTWIKRLRWQVRILEFIVLVLVVVVGLIVPTLDPPIWERWSAAKEVAEELIMSEADAVAAGIPGARTGEIEIPDDIESPEYFGTVYPEDCTFWETGGPHGQAYGHLARDYACSQNVTTPLISPINGIVTAKYDDGYGNPTLVLENQTWTATFLHMDKISVQLGDRVSVGQEIGNQGNKGYTLDFYGNTCGTGSSCGYHLHLNVYNKQLGQNVDPDQLIGRYIGGN